MASILALVQTLVQQYQNFSDPDQQRMLRETLVVDDLDFFRRSYYFDNVLADLEVDVTSDAYTRDEQRYIGEFILGENVQEVELVLADALESYFKGGTVPSEMDDDDKTADTQERLAVAAQRLNTVHDWTPLLADRIVQSIKRRSWQGREQQGLQLVTSEFEQEAKQRPEVIIAKLFKNLMPEITRLVLVEGFDISHEIVESKPPQLERKIDRPALHLVRQ